jgi:hypothetical protein
MAAGLVAKRDCVAPGASEIVCNRCDKMARRANRFGLSEIVSSRKIVENQNKSLAPSGKSDA